MGTSRRRGAESSLWEVTDTGMGRYRGKAELPTPLQTALGPRTLSYSTP